VGAGTPETVFPTFSGKGWIPHYFASIREIHFSSHLSSWMFIKLHGPPLKSCRESNQLSKHGCENTALQRTRKHVRFDQRRRLENIRYGIFPQRSNTCTMPLHRCLYSNTSVQFQCQYGPLLFV